MSVLHGHHYSEHRSVYRGVLLIGAIGIAALLYHIWKQELRLRPVLQARLAPWVLGGVGGGVLLTSSSMLYNLGSSQDGTTYTRALTFSGLVVASFISSVLIVAGVMYQPNMARVRSMARQ